MNRLFQILLNYLFYSSIRKLKDQKDSALLKQIVFQLFTSYFALIYYTFSGFEFNVLTLQVVLFVIFSNIINIIKVIRAAKIVLKVINSVLVHPVPVPQVPIPETKTLQKVEAIQSQGQEELPQKEASFRHRGHRANP